MIQAGLLGLGMLLSPQAALEQTARAAQTTAERAAAREQLLRQRVAALYRFSRGGLLQLLAESRDPAQTLTRLDSAKRVIDRDVREIAELQREHAELERNRQTLVAQIETLSQTSTTLAFDTRKGRLLLPVSGSTPKTSLGGLLFETASRARVRAVAAGRVLHVGPMPGFDEVVLLDHGGGLVSLYGNLAQPAVQADEQVAEGGAIGRVAKQSLYFELRRNAETVAALPWFRRP